MIISPARKYIFVHIPKTGGTSMAQALEARAHRDDILIGDTPKALRRKPRLKNLRANGRLWKHSTLADIDGLLSPTQISEMFTFTLVRNPWDRLVSYYHWARLQGFDHPAITLARNLDFADFLTHPHTAQSLRTSPYSSYMAGADGREYDATFLRLEHLHDDTAPLVAHLGFAPDLPHINRSERARDYRSCYSDALAEYVEKLCAPDIARFGYRFDP